MGILNSFESILYNVFKPLFEVTIDPISHPDLQVFLKYVRFIFIRCLMKFNSQINLCKFIIKIFINCIRIFKI